MFLVLGFFVISTVAYISPEFETAEEEVINSFIVERPHEDNGWEEGEFLEGLGYNADDEFIFLEEGDQGVYQEVIEFQNEVTNLNVTELYAEIDNFNENQHLEFIIFDGNIQEEEVDEFVFVSTEQEDISEQNELLITDDELQQMDFGSIDTDVISFEVKIVGENDESPAQVDRFRSNFTHDDIVLQEGEEDTILHNFGFLVLVLGALVGLLGFLGATVTNLVD